MAEAKQTKEAQESNGEEEAVAELAQKYGIEYVNPATLVPNPSNPRRHDMGAIRDSIKRYGFRGAVVARRSDYMLGAGHGRVKAAMELGIKEVPVVFVDDWSDWELTGFMLADNKVSDRAGYSEKQIHELVKEREAQAGDEGITSAGFQLPDYRALVRRAAPEDAKVTGKTREEAEKVYAEGVIRRITLFFSQEEHTSTLQRLEPIIDRFRMDNNTAAFLKLLAYYEAVKERYPEVDEEMVALLEPVEEAKPLVRRCVNCNKPDNDPSTKQENWHYGPDGVLAEGQFACSQTCYDAVAAKLGTQNGSAETAVAEKPSEDVDAKQGVGKPSKA